MIYRLLSIACALSLALCIATAVLWARSYRTGEQWLWMDRGDGRPSDYYNALIIGDGRLAFIRLPSTSKERAMWHIHSTPRLIADPPDFGVQRHALGFFLLGQPGGLTRGVVAPLWAIVAIAAMLPGWYAASWFSRKRHHLPGQLCRNCGYDLRASKDTCPECGTAMPAISRAIA
jgi:hypothetical protein